MLHENVTSMTASGPGTTCRGMILYEDVFTGASSEHSVKPVSIGINAFAVHGRFLRLSGCSRMLRLWNRPVGPLSDRFRGEA
jgi:hypothetical protein